MRKISTGQGDNYTTGCLLDFAYFEKNNRLIAADLSKQKVLHDDYTSGCLLDFAYFEKKL